MAHRHILNWFIRRRYFFSPKLYGRMKMPQQTTQPLFLCWPEHTQTHIISNRASVSVWRHIIRAKRMLWSITTNRHTPHIPHHPPHTSQTAPATSKTTRPTVINLMSEQNKNERSERSQADTIKKSTCGRLFHFKAFYFCLWTKIQQQKPYTMFVVLTNNGVLAGHNKLE